MATTKHSLDGAYELRTPEDSLRLYADWAADYDRDLTEGLGYAAPRHVAAALAAERREGDTPILDVGAGTGLVGDALAPELCGAALDGIDISPEMLAVANAKKRYRRLIEADLTRPLDLADASYGALVSTGTFTHGHVGHAALPELLRILAPGGLAVFSIKREAFDGEGFGSAFAMLVAEERIAPLRFRAIRLYDREDHEHGQARALIAIFRKAG